MGQRTYNLVPEGFDAGFTCTECASDIPAGYPFVQVLREPGEALVQLSGIPVMDPRCVYCDTVPQTGPR